MKKISLLLITICLISCGNRTKTSVADSDSLAVMYEVVDSVVVTEESEVLPTNSEGTGVILNFSSYHLYSSEDDKYDADGYQPVAASVTIDEDCQTATLNLYDSGDNRWYPFNFRIDDKLQIQEGVITYIVYNNANQKGYIYISTNRPGGLFIDINSFVLDGNAICCWMQDGGDNGSRYSDNTTINSAPRTHSAQETYSFPRLNSYPIHSEESIYDDYYNYKETNNCEEGAVVYEGKGGHYIIETRKGYTVIEDYSGSLYEGTMIRGELNQYNFKYMINRNGNKEIKVYVEDYMLSDKRAIELLGEKNRLKSDDQKAYDSYKD